MRYQKMRFPIHFLMAGLSLSACDQASDVPDQASTEQVSSAAVTQPSPRGLVCGMAYKNNNVAWVNGVCEGVATLTNTAATGFHIANDGDRGLSAGQGFYHQALNVEAGGLDPNHPEWSRVPAGTACGFKHTCNASANETCMGYDAARQCPVGWIKMQASDRNAPSGCNFAWCQYMDPNRLCTDFDCQVTNQPHGMACGITDSDMNNGSCLGTQTINGCPNGYQMRGFFDAGRSSGRGVGWCERL